MGQRGSPGRELQPCPALSHAAAALRASVLLFTCPVLSVEAVDGGTETFLLRSGVSGCCDTEVEIQGTVVTWCSTDMP